MKYLIFCLGLLFFGSVVISQTTTIDSSKYPKPLTLSAQEDSQNMMQQLGIKKLRPGPSGDPNAPNHANYD